MGWNGNGNGNGGDADGAGGVTNNRIHGARSWRQAKPVVLHPKFFQGFTDFRLGRPFDYRMLDAWPTLDQHRYENGRELAAECRLAGLAVAWIDRTRVPHPLKSLVVERAWARRSTGRDRCGRSGRAVSGPSRPSSCGSRRSCRG